MGIFNFLRKDSKDERFVSEQAFKSNFEKQTQMTPQTIKQLREYGIGETTSLKLEYFFYTNSHAKAEKLSLELEQLGYEVEFGKSAGDQNVFIITGWTNKILMSNETVLNWSKEMCQIGFKFDCDFDGWGTNPSQ